MYERISPMGPTVVDPILFFPYFSTKIYVVGTQNDRLIDMVLLSIQNIYNVKIYW